MFPFKGEARSIDYNLNEIALKSGFKFRDIENRRLDWKTLGCVDVNKVIENQDFEFLEKITPKIIEAPMQSILNSAALDPAVSSLFRLAQMSLQYLSFCQQFMSHTLFDLRTAFNLLQRKYTILKQNYKCIEEEHYKAQERIQLLLNEIKADRATKHIAKPVSLYPCDKCTKNFLTAESLRSHAQRKHSAIEEKHESSDDNEKGNFNTDKTVIPVEENANQLISTVNSETSISKQDVSQSNNNNENEATTNCNACLQKTGINSSSVATQCDMAIIDLNEESTMQTKINDEKQRPQHIENVSEKDESFENGLIESIADQTIIELRKEIEDLKNLLEKKACTEKPPEFLVEPKEVHTVQKNDKIDVIERKFNAFETMYIESQDKFIESFRSLDERHKVYMDNIQDTIKEIVEKSLAHHDGIEVQDVLETSKNDNEYEDKTGPSSENHNGPFSKPEEVELKACSLEAIMSTDSLSQSEGDDTKIICHVDVHTVSSADVDLRNQEDGRNSRKNTKTPTKIFKDMARNEFEQRLHQLGVDADSTGLTTPRSCEVNQDLAEEREEMKKAQKSFEMTRKKLRNQVNRIAKEKLVSASSVTSLSSTSYQSDDFILNDIDKHGPETVSIRPKSASVQKMRSRNAKKCMRKLVENDIDENDIMDKMNMAQKAIRVHRECIQELLHTTAHSPGTVTKIKYPTATKREEGKPSSSEINTNQYDKMPNITTRRVVFVNLDEDS